MEKIYLISIILGIVVGVGNFILYYEKGKLPFNMFVCGWGLAYAFCNVLNLLGMTG